MISASKDKKRMKRRGVAGNQRGQALAETGIVIVLLLLLIMGVVEFGRAFMVTNMIVHAARDGARTAAVVPASDRDSAGIIEDTSSIKTSVRSAIAAVVGTSVASAMTINVTQTAGPPPVVTLQVSGNVPFILHWAGFTNYTINRSVTFRDEGR